MVLFKNCFIILLLIITLVVPVFSKSLSVKKENSRKTLYMSLKKCIEIALKKNRKRSASRYSMEIAEAQYRQARSAYWPRLSLTSSYSIMDEDVNFIFPATPINLGDTSTAFAEAIAAAQLSKQNLTPATVPTLVGLGALPAGSTYQNLLAQTTTQVESQMAANNVPAFSVKVLDKEIFQTSLELKYPLYTGGMRDGLVKQTRAGVEASREMIRKTDIMIVHDVKKIYYAAVLAGLLTKLAEDVYARMNITLELTESLYKISSGRVKKTDFLRNKIMVESIRVMLVTIRNKYIMAQSALANVMGLKWEMMVGPDKLELPFKEVNFNLRNLVGLSYQFNPDWKMFNQQINAAEAKIKEERGGYYPKIGLFGKLTRIDTNYEEGFSTPDNNNSWIAGIGLKLPILDGRLTRNKVRAAKAKVKKLMQEKILFHEGLGLQVKNAFIKLAESSEKHKAALSAMNTSKENRELNTRAYHMEIVETKDIIEAQLMEAYMTGQYYMVLHEHKQALAEIEMIVGNKVKLLMK